MSFLKPIAFAAITWWAVLALTGRSDVALMLAAIPLVLGFLGVLTGPAYSLAALLFVAAIVLQVSPMLGIRVPIELTELRDGVARRTAPESQFPSPTAR